MTTLPSPGSNMVNEKYDQTKWHDTLIYEMKPHNRDQDDNELNVKLHHQDHNEHEVKCHQLVNERTQKVEGTLASDVSWWGTE